jgi:DNA-binding response OmpR family regulator
VVNEEATAAGAGRILVVEDDPWIRRMVCWALEEEGLQSDEAADGRVALACLAERRPALVLLDIGLPLVDGFGVADALHATYGEAVPIVVMTANGQAAKSAARVGATAFVAKPFDMSELLQIIRHLVEGDESSSAEVVSSGGNSSTSAP